MNLRKKILIVSILLWLPISAQITIKNYQRQIDTIQLDKDKIKAYLDVSWEYLLIENDSSLLFSEKAHQLAIKSQDAFGEVISLESKGLYYESVKNDYQKAIKLYLEAIAISEQHNLNYANSLYISLGIIFQETEDYKTAARYFKESVLISRKNKDNDVLHFALANYGGALKKLHKLDEAESAFLEVISLDENDVDVNLSCYFQLADIYELRGKLEKAYTFYKKALKLPRGEKITIRYLPNYSGILKNKIARKDAKGIDSLVVRLYSFIKNGTSLNYKITAYDAIYAAHNFKGEYKKAMLAIYNSKKLSDSVYIGKLKENTYELERKYENEKNRNALVKERDRRKNYSIGITILMIFIIVLAYFFYKRNKTNKLLSAQKFLLEKAIDEKNVLLKETHHRVKNSFQIVSSLLYLQSESIEDKEAKNAVKEAENRVKSMVLIHQKLYNKDELVGINTKEYISDLVTDIFESHQFKNETISYDLNIESLVLDIETITPIGLIVNELIINTLKHAFEVVTAKSKIRVIFKKLHENLYLEIIDNGKGFTGEVKNTSFGITLMNALSKKLNATLSYESDVNRGTEATLLITKYKLL